ATLCFHLWHSIKSSFDGLDCLRCRVSKLTEVAKHIGTLNLIQVDSLNYLRRGGLNCGWIRLLRCHSCSLLRCGGRGCDERPSQMSHSDRGGGHALGPETDRAPDAARTRCKSIRFLMRSLRER